MNPAGPHATPDPVVDGRSPGSISTLDRGLHFGDGLFETIACRSGKLRFASRHLQRLRTGCERLRFDPGSMESLRSELEAAASDMDEGILKVIVTRGVAVARGYAPSGNERPTRIVLRIPCALAEGPTAARAGVAALRLGENPVLAGIKHLNRLEQVLVQYERMERGLDELLMFSSSGRLVCGTRANVFLVARDGLRTPRLDVCGVAGIMRSVVMSEAARAGIAVEEGVLAAQDLEAAEEIFVTNARIGVLPLASLDARVLAIGPVTRRVQALLAPLLQDPRDV